MSWISDDYVCDNEKCSNYGAVIEKLGKRSERDTYICNGISEGSNPCKSKMRRLISATRTAHISWSTWRD